MSGWHGLPSSYRLDDRELAAAQLNSMLCALSCDLAGFGDHGVHRDLGDHNRFMGSGSEDQGSVACRPRYPGVGSRYTHQPGSTDGSMASFNLTLTSSAAVALLTTGLAGRGIGSRLRGGSDGVVRRIRR